MTDSRPSRGLGIVISATAAVFVAGQRVGSAVLVDDRRLLTAGHVLRLAKVGVCVPAHPIEVVFPTASAGGGARVPAQQVALGSAGATVDVGMLDLVFDGEPPDWLPTPVPLSPRRRLPARVSVFGFPRGEKALRGVWREFDTAGPAADATVQLDWAGDAGTLPGHSGGPVIDSVSGALVGVLVQGSQAGRFDRFVPLTVISRCCPSLPRPWLWTGADARSHFASRSRGQRSHSRGGDLFRGRQAALAAVRDWLTDPQGRSQPLVVTGQPGAGKSAVLARAALDLEAARAGPGVAFHARGAIHDDFLAAIADLTGVDHAETGEALLDALDNLPAVEPMMIVVDALDEAANGPDRRRIAETLGELAAAPYFRVAVATRPLAVDDPYRFGGLLPALGITSPDSAALVDLDTDRYFEPAGLYQFAAALLTQHDAKHPSPKGAAWTIYRANGTLCDRLAKVIAAHAHRNYLVTAMAAVPLSTAKQPVDPATAGFDPTSIPSGIGEALAKYLDELPEPRQGRTRALLTALAYARGGGIDDRTWRAFTEALGYPVTSADLDQLRASTGADYLLQTITEEQELLTRLFHQALVDELLTSRHQPSDELALLSALRPVPGTTWATASAYSLTYAADHASSARQLLSLLGNPHYLAHADLTRLPSLLSLEPETMTDPLAVLVRQVASRANPLPPARRVRFLALAAAHFGLPDMRRRLAAVYNQPVTPMWAHSLGPPHMELTGHTDQVRAVGIGFFGNSPVIVSGSRDKTVRVWDAATGQPRGQPLTGHTGSVEAVAIGRIGERDVIISGSQDKTVRVWDGAIGCLVGEPVTGDGWAWVVAIGRIREPPRRLLRGPGRRVGRRERDVIAFSGLDELDEASGGWAHKVWVWDAATGRSVCEPLAVQHRQEAVAIGRIGGRDVIVCSADYKLQLWDATTGQPRGEPLTGHTGSVEAVAIGRIGQQDVIVSGSVDSTVRVWDATTSQPRGEPLTGHTGSVEAVAIGRIGGRDVIVSGGADSTVRVWDAATSQPRGEPLTGHSREVEAVAIGRIGGRDVIVSGGADNTVRVWDAAIERFPTEPLTGHTDPVRAVAIGRISEHDVVVSGSQDKTVRVWDAATGQPRGEPLTGHTGSVEAVAIGRIGRRDVIVSGSHDYTVRVWDAATGQPRSEPLTDHTGPVEAVAIGRIGERDVIVSNGWGYKVQVWNAATGQPRGTALTGHTSWVRAVAIGRIGDRDVIVSGSHDSTVRVWDAATSQPRGEPLTHGSYVWAVAIGRIGDRDVIVSGGHDNVVRVWDGTTGQPRGEPLTGHSDAVRAVAIGRIGDRDVIVSGSLDHTVRIWDLAEGGSMVIDLLGAIRAVALTKTGSGLCVSAGHTICLFKA